MIKIILFLFLSTLPFMRCWCQVENINNHDGAVLNPGSISSIVFNIKNESKSTKEYQINTKASTSDIIAIINSGDVSIPPDSSLIYIVPIKISKEASPGNYSLSLLLRNKKDDSISEITKYVSITKDLDISMSLLNAPKYVLAGDTIESQFILKNEGNVAQSIQLKSQLGQLKGNQHVILNANESKVIHVISYTDQKLAKRLNQNIDLTAITSDSTSQPVKQYSSVDIIPVSPIAEDIYHRFPVYASLSYMYMRDRGVDHKGFQGEIYGRGTLSDHSELELRAITANPVQFNAFTPYEEYFISYRTKNTYAHLGDKMYSSSFLTEYARYGRGAELYVQMNNLELGGFYNRPRFNQNITDEVNIYSKYSIDSNLNITGGYLFKNMDNKRNYLTTQSFLDGKAHLPYLILNTSILKGFDISTELALSRLGSIKGSAYRIYANGNIKNLFINLAYMSASPKFAGYFNNTKTLNGNLRYRLSKKIDLMGNYLQDAQNFQRDTLFLAAPYRNNIYYGINYQFANSGNVFLYSGYQKYKDRQIIKRFDYQEFFVRINLNQSWKKLNFNLEGQLGVTDNYITQNSGTTSYISSHIGYTIFNSSFNLFASINRSSRYNQIKENQIYYGGTIMSRITPSTTFNLFYQNNYLPEEYYKDRNLLEATIKQQIAKGHSIEFSGRYLLQQGQIGHKDFIASIRYTAMLNVPTKKIASYASLSGHVHHRNGKSLSGVRVKLGPYQTVTDNKGMYIIKNIIPGEYFITIDRTTIGIDEIVENPHPRNIYLHDNSEIIHNIQVSQSAKINGKVIASVPQEGTSLSKSGKDRNKKTEDRVLIEVSSGETVYRKFCTLNEDFDFTYLQPGEWTVKIYPTDLNSKYKIGTDLFSFQLQPAETKNISVPIIVNEPVIKYQKDSLEILYKAK